MSESSIASERDRIGHRWNPTALPICLRWSRSPSRLRAGSRDVATGLLSAFCDTRDAAQSFLLRGRLFGRPFSAPSALRRQAGASVMAGQCGHTVGFARLRRRLPRMVRHGAAHLSGLAEKMYFQPQPSSALSDYCLAFCKGDPRTWAVSLYAPWRG